MIRVDDSPAGTYPSDHRHAVFQNLLDRFLTADGKVRYQSWHDDPDALQVLDAYLAMLARTSPDSDPATFERVLRRRR